MKSNTKGIIFALAGGLLFALMGLFVKLARVDATVLQLLFVRGFCSLLILAPIVGKEIKKIFKNDSLSIWMRSFFGGISVVCYFWNIGVSSLALAILLADLTPLFVIAIGYFAFGIRVSFGAVLGSVLTVFGVGNLVLPQASGLSFESLALGITGSATAAGAYISLKKASGKYSAYLIVWCFSLIMTLISLKEVGNLGLLMKQELVIPLAGMVFASLLAQICMTKSYQYLAAHTAASLTLSSAIWAVVFDNLILGSQLSLLTLVSFGIIIFGLIIVQHFSAKPIVKI